MNFKTTVKTIFLKEIRLELRSREIVLSTAVFALLIVVLSGFVFGADEIDGNTAAGGALWLALTVGGVLAIGRSYLNERVMGVWTGIILSPASKAGIFAGKTAAIFTFLFLIALILLPVISILFKTGIFAHIHFILPVILLGLLGFSAPGILFGSMIVSSNARDLLLGVVLLPLVSPVLILSAKATVLAMSGSGFIEISAYLKLLAGLDIIYLSLGIWLFGPLVEE